MKTSPTIAQLQNSLRRARAAFSRHVGWHLAEARRLEKRIYQLEIQIEART